MKDVSAMQKGLSRKESPFCYLLIELLDPLVHAARLSRQLLC